MKDVSRGDGVLSRTSTRALIAGAIVVAVAIFTPTGWGVAVALAAVAAMAADTALADTATYEVPRSSAAARAVDPETGQIDTDAVRRVLVATGQAKSVLRGDEQHHEGTDLEDWAVTPDGDVHLALRLSVKSTTAELAGVSEQLARALRIDRADEPVPDHARGLTHIVLTNRPAPVADTGPEVNWA